MFTLYLVWDSTPFQIEKPKDPRLFNMTRSGKDKIKRTVPPWPSMGEGSDAPAALTGASNTAGPAGEVARAGRKPVHHTQAAKGEANKGCCHRSREEGEREEEIQHPMITTNRPISPTKLPASSFFHS